MLLKFLFGGGSKRKSSRAARVRKLANKVAKLKRTQKLKNQEMSLKNQLNKMRGF
jgi:hypothetical protein